MSDKPEEIKSKNNENKKSSLQEILSESKVEELPLDLRNKKKEDNENKLYKATFLLAVFTMLLVIVTFGQLFLNNWQFQTINRPILSVGNIVIYVDNQSKIINSNLYLENSGNLPAKYEISKLSYFDQNGNEKIISIEFPSSVVFPKSQNRFIYFSLPYEVLNNRFLNLTLSINYSGTTDSNKNYFYYEKFGFDLLLGAFSTIDANAN